MTIQVLFHSFESVCMCFQHPPSFCEDVRKEDKKKSEARRAQNSRFWALSVYTDITNKVLQLFPCIHHLFGHYSAREQLLFSLQHPGLSLYCLVEINSNFAPAAAKWFAAVIQMEGKSCEGRTLVVRRREEAAERTFDFLFFFLEAAVCQTLNFLMHAPWQLSN